MFGGHVKKPINSTEYFKDSYTTEARYFYFGMMDKQLEKNHGFLKYTNEINTGNP